MREKEIHQHRKDEHLSLGIKYWKNQRNEHFSGLRFSDVRMVPQGLPELALDEIDLSVRALNTRFEQPFYIEAMTGGSTFGDKINAQLAEIAAAQNLPMAVGSQSIAIKYPELTAGFQKLRKINPDGFMFANLGAHHNLEAAKRAVDMLEANALELHINVAQELTMKNGEGDRDFYWLENINEIANKINVPLIVKEVGFGFSKEMFHQLSQTAVSAINVGGKGGTNFAWIEHQRGGEFELEDYGFTTVESLLEAQHAQTQKTLIGTGGITAVSDIVKAQLLGADLVSAAGFVLHQLMENGSDPLQMKLENWKKELRRYYALQGVKNKAALKKRPVLLSMEAQYFLEQRRK